MGELWAFCQCIASETFPDPQHVQLAQNLSACLSVAAFLDIMRLKVSLNGDDGSDKKDLVLSRKSVVSNVHIQTELNRAIGTSLDVERWAQAEDEKKVYRRCGMMVQKEVVKRGRAFLK